MDTTQWINEVNLLLKKMNQVGFNYPLGDNIVRSPGNKTLLPHLMTISGLASSSPFISFFEQCDGLNLPDVYVGYYIHTLEGILRGIENGEPVRISEPIDCKIIVFGSDGGGGRFAMRVDEHNEVLYLPVGAVYHGTFDGQTRHIKLLSDDFIGFLKRLKSDIKSFIENEKGWEYMV